MNWKLTNAALIVTLVGVLAAGKVHEQNVLEENRAQFNVSAHVTQQVETAAQEIAPLSISFEQYEHILLIGDNTMTGFNNKEIAENEVVFESEQAIHHEVSHLPHTWTNDFRTYMQTAYPNASFTNGAIANKSARWFNSNKGGITIEPRTLAFVMLGTNDRWDTVSIEEYKKQYTAFLQQMKEQADETIVIISPPSLTDDLEMMNFTMEEVAQAAKEICEAQGLRYISVYDAIHDAAERQNRELVSYLQADGPHLTDVGNDIVWAYVKQQLALQ